MSAPPSSEGAQDPGETVRLRLDLAYDGTGFHGWAKQADPELRTVEGTLADALSLVLRAPVELTVAGRTDRGVHAAGQVAHADVPAESLNQRAIGGNPARLVRRMSRLLPGDVCLTGATVAPPGFDARFSALRRRYRYRVSTAPAGPLPTRRVDTASWPKPVDLGLAQVAADALVGLHDFAAFCRAKPHATTVRDLEAFTWRDCSTPEEPGVLEADVVADAFCWSMVRSLVGWCLAVGEGRRDPAASAGLLSERERSSAVPVAPACGLTLVAVDYPPDEELAERARATRATRPAV